MAKLLDRIRRANAGEGVRIGFGASANKPVPPRLAVIARQSASGVDAVKAAIEAGVDAVLLASVPSKPDLEAALADGDKAVVGLTLGESLPDNLDELIEAGLDFLVLTSTRLPVRILRQENLAVGLELPSGLDDNRLRALAGAPGAFVVTPLPGGDHPTLEDLIEVRRVGLFLSRPIFVDTSAGLSTEDLAALRDSGLGAILVDGSDVKKLKALRDRLNELPAPIKPPADRPAAVLPVGSIGGRDSE